MPLPIYSAAGWAQCPELAVPGSAGRTGGQSAHRPPVCLGLIFWPRHRPFGWSASVYCTKQTARVTNRVPLANCTCWQTVSVSPGSPGTRLCPWLPHREGLSQMCQNPRLTDDGSSERPPALSGRLMEENGYHRAPSSRLKCHPIVISTHQKS